MRRLYPALTILSLLIAVLFIGDAIAQDLTIGNYQLVSTKRITRTEYEYTYTAKVTNTGSDAKNVMALARSNSQYTTVVDGALSFGNVGSRSSVRSSDTFIIRVNRSYAFSWSNINWEVASGEAVALLSDGKLVVGVVDSNSDLFGTKIEIREENVQYDPVLLAISKPTKVAPDALDRTKRTVGPEIEIRTSRPVEFINEVIVTIPYYDQGDADLEKTIQIYTSPDSSTPFCRQPLRNILRIDTEQNLISFLTSHFSQEVARIPGYVPIGSETYSPNDVSHYEKGLEFMKDMATASVNWPILNVNFRLTDTFAQLEEVDDDLEDIDISLVTQLAGDVYAFIDSARNVGMQLEISQENGATLTYQQNRELFKKILVEIVKTGVLEAIESTFPDVIPYVGSPIFRFSYWVFENFLTEAFLKQDEIYEGNEFLFRLRAKLGLAPIGEDASGSSIYYRYFSDEIQMFEETISGPQGGEAKVYYNLFKSLYYQPPSDSDTRLEIERKVDVTAPYFLILISQELGKLKVEPPPLNPFGHAYADKVYLNISSFLNDPASSALSVWDARRACQGGDCFWVGICSLHRLGEHPQISLDFFKDIFGDFSSTELLAATKGIRCWPDKDELVEKCGDKIDNNGNGLVDEDCGGPPPGQIFFDDFNDGLSDWQSGCLYFYGWPEGNTPSVVEGVYRAGPVNPGLHHNLAGHHRQLPTAVDSTFYVQYRVSARNSVSYGGVWVSLHVDNNAIWPWNLPEAYDPNYKSSDGYIFQASSLNGKLIIMKRQGTAWIRLGEAPYPMDESFHTVGVRHLANGKWEVTVDENVYSEGELAMNIADFSFNSFTYISIAVDPNGTVLINGIDDISVFD